jgi:hypothetical protein
MMQEWPIRPDQAFKPKIGISAGGKATITSLPIITSRDYQYSLSDLRTWLVYLQKITEHNEPFMPALMKQSTYITVNYRNSIHALSCCMDSIQPQTPSIWMECILASHISRHAECTRMTKRGDITTHDMFILNRACHPSYDFIWKAHVYNTWTTRREDGINGMDHSTNPRISRDAAQHTYKARGSSSLVVQASNSNIK